MQVFYGWRELLVLQMKRLSSTAYFLLADLLFLDPSIMLLAVAFRVLA